MLLAVFGVTAMTGFVDEPSRLSTIGGSGAALSGIEAVIVSAGFGAEALPFPTTAERPLATC